MARTKITKRDPHQRYELRAREEPPWEEEDEEDEGKTPVKADAKAKGKTPVKADAKAKGKTPVKADAKAKGKTPVKADAKAKGKMPVTADEKAERKKTVASGKLKIGDSGESETAQKRKVISREGNTEAGGSQVKKVKTRNKNETEKGAVGTTRVLRSHSAKKGGEAGKEAIMPSAAKESTSKRATRVGASRQVALQKNVKGKNILKRNEAEEASNDEDMHISGKKKKDSLTIGSSKPKKSPPAKKEVPLTIGSPKPRENLQAEPSKRTTRRVGKSSEALSQESAGGSTAVASSSKTVGKQVSKAEKKKGGVPASTPSRKNPPRKGRAAAKTDK